MRTAKLPSKCSPLARRMRRSSHTGGDAKWKSIVQLKERARALSDVERIAEKARSQRVLLSLLIDDTKAAAVMAAFFSS